MGLFSVFGDSRGGYSKAESLLFDRVLINVAGPFHAAAMAGLAPLIQPGMRILDVGCGGGQFAMALADRFPNVEIVGVDLSHEQVARAVRRSAARRDRLSFVQGSALALPLDSESFDLVYSIGSLKHWPNHRLGLSECARVGKLGAPLFVMEGDRGGRQEDLEQLATAWKVPQPMRAVAAAFFRVMVVGQSLDITDAKAVLASVPTFEGTVERVKDVPVFAIVGHRVK